MDYEKNTVPKPKKRNVVLSVVIITFLARVLSLLSIQLYLSFFGSNDPQLKIFLYALTIPDLLFTSIGSAIMTVCVPIYSSAIANNELDRAKRFIDNLITVVSMLNFLLIFLGVLIAPAITFFLNESDYLTFSLRVLMPIMFFYGLNYIFQAVLQSQGHFKLPALVSLPSSLVVITYICVLGRVYAVTGLLFASLLGLSLQALIMVPAVIKLGYRYKFRLELSPDIKLALKLSVPTFISVVAYQVNMLFSNTLASSFEAFSLLRYVQMLVVQTVLTFVFALTSVYYPKLSRLWSQENFAGYKKTLTQITTTVLFFLIPAVFGVILLRENIFDLLSRWGKVNDNDIHTLALFLGIYALSIPMMALKEIFDRGFFAQKNTKISSVVGFVIMAVNIVACLLLVNQYGILGVPIAYVISVSAGTAVLVVVMRIRIGGYKILTTLLKYILSALVMSVAVYFIKESLDAALPQPEFLFRMLRLMIPVGIGAALYIGICYIIKAPNARIPKKPVNNDTDF
ncbi:MAG: polysaccharide biosynthesis C-terminal domain-containing protein [Peptococcaceae bacterium]|nr:polysaccharide biosynthesis C-terminal domain-containing protein [Peptococcaceae bacterium]